MIIMKVNVAQSCQTLCDPVDYTVHGILQARILEWVATPSPAHLPTQESNKGLLYCRQILYQLSYQGSPDYNDKSNKKQVKETISNMESELASSLQQK